MPLPRRSQRGFTLVELLVTIAILGVLAAVVVVSLDRLTGDADKSACQADERALTNAEEVHHVETGTYADEQTLVDAKRIRDLSTLHDIVITTDDYEIVGIDSCVVDDDEVASGTGGGLRDADQALEQADQNLNNSSGRLSTGRRINRARDDAAGLNSFGAGWTASGAAAITDGAAILTPEKEGATGAVFLATPVPTADLRVSFTASSGKDGQGFASALLDADTATESPGKGGAGLGFAGLSGYGITVEPRSEKGVPLVSITDGHDGFKHLESAAVEGLADGWHEYTVEIRDSVIVVAVDGTVILGYEVKLSKTTRLAFTAANGGSAASQVVAKVSIGSGQLLTQEELKKQAQQQAVLELLR